MSSKFVHVFVGPTQHDIQPQLLEQEHFILHSPVRRGDVSTLTSVGIGQSVIAIVDGTFHSYPSVGHREIKDAMVAGWEVWGLSSMGAIRAAEMQALGMRGGMARFSSTMPMTKIFPMMK